MSSHRYLQKWYASGVVDDKDHQHTIFGGIYEKTVRVGWCSAHLRIMDTASIFLRQ